MWLVGFCFENNQKITKDIWSEQFYKDATHCVKNGRIWSYSGPHFPAFGLHSVRMRENAGQNNSKYGHFSRSDFGWLHFKFKVVETQLIVQYLAKNEV